MMECISSLLKSDPEAEVRKAAAMFATLLLQGLGKDAIKVRTNKIDTNCSVYPEAKIKENKRCIMNKKVMA